MLPGQMERLFLVVVMTTVCWSAPQDMSAKMFTFPVESDSAYAKLIPTKKIFASVTVCLRYFTDQRKGQSLFSMATPSHHNDIMLYKDNTLGSVSFWIRDVGLAFKELPDLLNTWSSTCGTWDSASGLGQLWVNGKASTRRQSYSGAGLDGSPVILLGQEQDSYGGGFSKEQAFVGSISDVHMWDYVLSPCEIRRFTADLNYTPGNVLNWRGLSYTLTGRVVVEERQQDQQCQV
ncbi:LOW QUALITY PROTEIN: C-reactive protein-like [Osmerus mordax]|uniref:LOW QUALITY PROTEIN: C-reactive protein-like n=1 Tax=Osmerus mordax TaxID=8014 RepID=UPI003510B88D